MFDVSGWGSVWLLAADIAVMLALAAAMLGAARLYCTAAAPIAADEAIGEASFGPASGTPNSATH